MAQNQTAEKPEVKIFKCLYCNIKPFAQKSHLTTHTNLKHENSGKRECISCSSSFAQINNFIKHYKKQHLNENCDQCIGNELCKICELDLKTAKLEWQLKLQEVQSPRFEPVGGHTCNVCQKTFFQVSHLNAHAKLKHGPSKRILCPECTSTFAQMNNFVVHYKKNHLNCSCQNAMRCNECITKVSHAKQMALTDEATNIVQPALEDSLRDMFAGSVSDINISANLSSTSNASAPTSTVTSPVLSTDANVSLIQPAISLVQILSAEPTQQLITTPAKRMKRSESSVVPLEAVHNFKLEEANYSTPVSNELATTSSSPSFDAIIPLATTNTSTHTLTMKSDLIHKTNPRKRRRKSVVILCEKPIHNTINDCDTLESCKFTVASQNPPNVPSIQINPCETNVISFESDSRIEIIPTPESVVRAHSLTSNPVYDEMLGKIHSTQVSSETAHIITKSKEKHLVRANVSTVLREAAKPQLDIAYLKKVPDVEKCWIIVTYIRQNPQIDYAKICKEVDADCEKVNSFLEQDISCEEAMGMYPGAYIRLKNDFKHNGVNTEVRCLPTLLNNIF